MSSTSSWYEGGWSDGTSNSGFSLGVMSGTLAVQEALDVGDFLGDVDLTLERLDRQLRPRSPPRAHRQPVGRDRGPDDAAARPHLLRVLRRNGQVARPVAEQVRVECREHAHDRWVGWLDGRARGLEDRLD